MKNSNKKKSHELPMSFEESLRRECPAIFEWTESVMGAHEVDPRQMQGMQPYDPEAEDDLEDPNDPGSQWLAANAPTPNFSSAQKGGYMNPTNTPPVKASVGLGQRLPSANRNALIGQIGQKLQSLDPQRLAALLKQLG